MKIVNVSATPTTGGAARAAYRLHRALRVAGVDASMVVRDALPDDASVMRPATQIGRVLARVRPVVEAAIWQAHRRRTRGTFTPSVIPDRSAQRINALEPDVLN